MAAQHQAAPASAPGDPLVALAGAASRLLGRAVGACLASDSAPGAHTVVLELQQRPESLDRLGVRGDRAGHCVQAPPVLTRASAVCNLCTAQPPLCSPSALLQSAMTACLCPTPLTRWSAAWPRWRWARCCLHPSSSTRCCWRRPRVGADCRAGTELEKQVAQDAMCGQPAVNQLSTACTHLHPVDRPLPAPPSPAAGSDEAVVRRYCLRASSTAGHPPLLMPAEAAAKPPGSTLQGSVFEATVWLQPPAEAGASGPGDGPLAGQPPAAHRPASAQAVVGCLQQLLGMLRVLAPPVRLLMRLDGVLLQVGAACWRRGGLRLWVLLESGPRLPTGTAWHCTTVERQFTRPALQDPDGRLQPVSGCRRLDLPLDAGLGPLARFSEGGCWQAGARGRVARVLAAHRH